MKKLTVNIYKFLNSKDINYSKLLQDYLRKEVRKHKDNNGDGSLCKKTLVVDEKLLQEAKRYNINFSQLLNKALFELNEAKEKLDKYKK